MKLGFRHLTTKIERKLRRKASNSKERMTKISDLSLDMVGEILSRVPPTSLTAVRSTCKTWNDSSKTQVLGENAARKDQFLEIKVIGDSVCSLRFDLQGVRNDKDERHFSDPSMKQISIPNYQDEIYKKVHHCDGLLLCVTEYKEDYYYSKRLLVWNPYLGQTRWIRQRSTTGENDTYALGYGYNKNNNRNYKILRSFYHTYGKKKGTEVYDLSSDSWRVLDVSPDWPELLYLVRDSVFVKGITYLLGMIYDDDVYLVCFDFTRERFGPRLPLPFPSSGNGTVTLSCVRGEKLAALYSHDDMMIEIWISSKTEPNAVSWSPFLKLDMSLMNAFPDNCFRPISFFIDEEKRIAVLFDLHHDYRTGAYYYQMGYIFGKDGYFKSVKSELVLNHRWRRYNNFVCSSYVPSLVQLQINQPDETKERNQQEETQEEINQPDERKETIEEIKQPEEREETNQREQTIEEIKQPEEREETKEEINQPDERKETNQRGEETKEQRKETNQPAKNQERNHPGKSEQQINKERRERNKRSKMRKRNQRVKRKERDDDQSLPFSLPFLFLALFISSFVFFFFIFFSVHL